MPPYPDSEFLPVPLDVGVAGIGNDAAVAAVIYRPDHAKVVDCIATFVVVDMVNRAGRAFPEHEEPSQPVSGILPTANLDLNVPVSTGCCSSKIADGHAHCRFDFPVKPSGYNAVIQKAFDIMGNWFHACILPQSG